MRPLESNDEQILSEFSLSSTILHEMIMIPRQSTAAVNKEQQNYGINAITDKSLGEQIENAVTEHKQTTDRKESTLMCIPGAHRILRHAYA